MKIKDLPDYMKIIDIEEIENELYKVFDSDVSTITAVMCTIRDCILDEEEIRSQIE